MGKGVELWVLSQASAWVLLIRQTVTETNDLYKAVAEWETSFGNEEDPNFSRLDTLSNYRHDGKFHFKMVWPDMTGHGQNFNEWKQSSDPFMREEIAGYEAVSVPFTDKGFGGLEYNGNGRCVLDGSVNSPGWWYAIGTRAAYSGGIPGPDVVVKKVELWALKPSAQPASRRLSRPTEGNAAAKVDVQHK